jgi:hypothetical protein
MSPLYKKFKLLALVMLATCAFAQSIVAEIVGKSGLFTYVDKGDSIEIKALSRTAPELVAIPASINGKPVTSIGEGAFGDFWKNYKITGITIPDSVTSIGDSAFSHLNMTSITLGNGLVSIGSGAFEKTSLNSVTIPDSVITIGDNAFAYSDLTSVTLGNGVTSIGSGAFKYTDITSLIIPDSVTAIGESALSTVSRVSTLTVGSGITQIDYRSWGIYPTNSFHVSPENSSYQSVHGVLYNKQKTEIIYYPPERKAANNGVFEIPEGVRKIADGFLGGSALVGIIIPRSVRIIGNEAFLRCENLQSITVDKRNRNFSSMDGILYNKDQTSLVRYPEGRKGMFHDMPDTVTSIEGYAFYGCVYLHDIIIPPSVVSIGAHAFEISNLGNITIPSSVKSIGERAFHDRYYSRIGDDGILFLGDAPSIGEESFLTEWRLGRYNYYPPENIYFLEGASGFDTEEWLRYSVTAIKPAPALIIYPDQGKRLVHGEGNINFRNNQVGKVGKTMTFTIKNAGSKTLKLQRPLVTTRGRHAGDFLVSRPAKRSLAPGATMKFKIAFRPKAAGLRKASLIVHSNDPETRKFTIDVEGLGARP